METARVLQIRHVTEYRYDRPVDRSVHQGHLRPIHDHIQDVLDHELTIETDLGNPIQTIDYEDAFGNRGLRFEVQGPYRRLKVEAVSHVALAERDPYDITLYPKRPTVPLNWMPRERLALSQYLQSEELPDTQVEALFEYAMTFVRANNDDLLEALFAMNLALYHDFEYVPGSTSNATTPYEVFSTKRGVCQDFAGLFIAMARLIRVPARYVCGYLYTGNAERDQQNGEGSASRAPSDATHAWVELYLPNVGWIAFDPTNGVLPRLNHVRLSVGRFWRDTSPVHGTLYGPRVKEELNAAVSVLDVTDGQPANRAAPAAAA